MISNFKAIREETNDSLHIRREFRGYIPQSNLYSYVVEVFSIPRKNNH
jgi:hypothetical protein